MLSKMPNVYLTDSQLYGCVQFLDNSLPGWEALLAMFPFLEIFINLLVMIEKGNIPVYTPQAQSEAIIYKPERRQLEESAQIISFESVLSEMFGLK